MADVDPNAPALSGRTEPCWPTVAEVEDLIGPLVESATALGMVARYAGANDLNAAESQAVEWLADYVDDRAEEMRAVLGARAPRWLTQLTEKDRHKVLDRFTGEEA